jgi:hypothetical protein
MNPSRSKGHGQRHSVLVNRTVRLEDLASITGSAYGGPVSDVDGYSGMATTKHIVLGGTPELLPPQSDYATLFSVVVR